MNIYGIKDSANLTVKYKAGTNAGKVFVYSDYATVSTNDWTSEQVFARSKNVNAIRWDYNRQSTLKVDMEIFDLKWISMVFGNEFISGASDILKREVLTVATSGTGTGATFSALNLSAIPKDSASVLVYTLDDDGLTNKAELTATTDYTVSIPTGNTGSASITPVKPSGTDAQAKVASGDKIVVYYMTSVESAQKLTVNADEYPDNFEIFGDTMIRGTDGQDEFVQMHYLNVKPKSQITLTFDAGNIATLSIEFDILKDTASSDMATYTIY